MQTLPQRLKLAMKFKVKPSHEANVRHPGTPATSLKPYGAALTFHAVQELPHLYSTPTHVVHTRMTKANDEVRGLCGKSMQ